MWLETPVPVNFVCTSPFDVDKAMAAPDIDALIASDFDVRMQFSGAVGADINMIALTYFYLREAGYEGMELSTRPRAGAINVIHTCDLDILGADASRFDVSVRGDFPHRWHAQCEIVQNRWQQGANAETIWLWPQSGIIPRAAPAGRMKRIGYLGQLSRNLVWDEQRWREFLAPLGVEFCAYPPDRWHDYSNLDAVIAIRTFGEHKWRGKPPSKLVNAWIGRVPCIAGSDSAFLQIGTPGIDFLRATTPEGIRDAVARLVQEPGLAERIIAAGNVHLPSFSREAIMKTWVDFLQGTVADRYDRFASHPHEEASRTRILWTGDRVWTRGKRIARKTLNAIQR
ncbi:hypothetical protein [Croceicoccus bisphenolivorans]|uniref:hypothetical protein n=1 Tax=Croceicoccus bisphenolivorans TaxID=1783232 RepID=UPI0008332A94|nr:hypothetical protein [Croceicoccus bisphenolivorans]